MGAVRLGRRKSWSSSNTGFLTMGAIALLILGLLICQTLSEDTYHVIKIKLNIKMDS